MQVRSKFPWNMNQPTVNHPQLDQAQQEVERMAAEYAREVQAVEQAGDNRDGREEIQAALRQASQFNR